MTELTEIQLTMLKAIVYGGELTLKGLPYVNFKRAMHKAGYMSPDGTVTSAGLDLVRVAPTSPDVAPTRSKAKSAILPSEKAQRAPKGPKKAAQTQPPKEEPKAYEPTGPYTRIVDEKQKTVGYIYAEEGLFHAVNLMGQLVNRGLSAEGAEKRFRQLTGKGRWGTINR